MSIEKHSNIIKDPNIKRIIEYSNDNKQINILDTRYYRRNNKYYPSVSSILNYFPKGKYFEDFIKSNGFNSDIIAQKAAYEGTQVHKAVEKFLDGEEIIWVDQDGVAQYNLDVWKMILKFTQFWKEYKPELIASEYHLFSDEYMFAGTTDLVVKMGEKYKMIDIKTSNSLHTSQKLQLAAYAQAWNETHDVHIEEIDILWLKAATRGPAKDKIQGSGWQLKSAGDINSNFEMFKKIYDIYKIENPDDEPVFLSLPLSVKLND